MSQSIAVMINIEGPRLGIDPGTSSPQGENASHYTNGDNRDSWYLCQQVSLGWLTYNQSGIAASHQSMLQTYVL